MEGVQAARRSRAGIAQEKSGCGRRDGAEIGRGGLECDVAAGRADRRRSARAIGLRSVGRDGNALRGRRAAGRRARAGVADKHIGHAIRIAIHQIHRGRKERHVAPVRADRRRNTVAIGGVAAQSDGYQRVGRRAAGRRALASIADKNILHRAGNFGDAVRGSKNLHGVAMVRTQQRQRQQAFRSSDNAARILSSRSDSHRRGHRSKNGKWTFGRSSATGRGINHSNLIRCNRCDIRRGDRRRESVCPYECGRPRAAVPLNDRARQQIASIHRENEGAPSGRRARRRQRSRSMAPGRTWAPSW